MPATRLTKRNKHRGFQIVEFNSCGAKLRRVDPDSRDAIERRCDLERHLRRDHDLGQMAPQERELYEQELERLQLPLDDDLVH